MSRTEELKQRMQAKGAANGTNGNNGAGQAAGLAQSTKADQLAHFLQSPAVMAQIAKALPRHLTADRLIRIATTELRKNPKLAQCTPQSFVGAVVQCAQLGLEPGNALGHVYIVPFMNRVKRGNQWVSELVATTILGYRGMIDLARRSGQIESIEAWPVYLGDRFECVLGLDPNLIHAPDWENAGRTNADNLRFVYAVAKLKDGGKQFAVMARAEVMAIRDRTFAKNKVNPAEYDGPWRTDFEQMALKTVVRRLFKMLPVSIEQQIADALAARNANLDPLTLDNEVAGLLGDNPTPTFDMQFNEGEGREPVVMAGEGGAVAVAEDGPEPLKTDFDDLPSLGQRIENALLNAKSRDTLDLAADEIRELASPAEREKLTALYRERCNVLQ